MTQWLVEEAVALKERAQLARTPEDEAADELMARHGEMLALRAKQRGS